MGQGESGGSGGQGQCGFDVGETTSSRVVDELKFIYLDATKA